MTRWVRRAARVALAPSKMAASRRSSYETASLAWQMIVAPVGGPAVSSGSTAQTGAFHVLSGAAGGGGGARATSETMQADRAKGRWSMAAKHTRRSVSPPRRWRPPARHHRSIRGRVGAEAEAPTEDA